MDVKHVQTVVGVNVKNFIKYAKHLITKKIQSKKINGRFLE